ncbi:acyl carrier protein [Acidiferrobacter thiooxydans]|jgi:acyl carrier protein|uniref:Polyketide synthase n=1 Tax=Acidiferrobacter thiooxydans TaxID=163359 RepID=A0A368HCM7_9GAMM|nr:acyl carrier protein [Acidiferrobacter thiooxydans]MDA8120382.1 acyl carrier protein [Gammaproteobacteria bacterium]RCN56195.1 polyketide synthase [Acidiferrobacter thiooxydans]
MSVNYSKTAIIDFILDKVSPQIGIAKHIIDVDAPLASYGVDSVNAISLCADLEDWLKVPVDTTIAWDYPSIEKMADFLTGEVATRASESAA